MLGRRIAQTMTVGGLALGLTGARSPARQEASCLFENYELQAWLTRAADHSAMTVIFENGGRQNVPAFGFKVAIYRWLSGNKAYTSNYFSINVAGVMDPNFVQVAPTDCYTERRYKFNLKEVLKQYYGQKILVKIIYDPALKDADNLNHNPTMSFVL